MQEVKIIPIFDQSAPDVWTNFARVQASTMLTNYNYKMPVAIISERIADGRKDWRCGTHFAFGAFAGDKMVGFIQGRACGRVARVQSLYVLQSFQKRKIGGGLLHSAEQAVGLFAGRIELVALPKAEPFYRAHGYTSQFGINTYKKNKISEPRCGSVPVFRCGRVLASKIQNLDATFTADMVNKRHLPTFVYFDATGRVVGCAIDGKITVDPHNGISNIVSGSLQRNMANIR